MTDENAPPTLEEYRRQFSSYTDEDLVKSLNREVGNPGWTSSRGRYLAALHAELRARDFDFTAVGELKGIPGMRKFRLERKCLIYAA